MSPDPLPNSIAVVIPSYRVTSHICDVIARIGPSCSAIYVVDDCCPDNSGEYVMRHCNDPRIVVIRNERNLGVGGAVMAGYSTAIRDGHQILVKIDGDGQMAPELIDRFAAPIISGVSDYTKGNRFYDLRDVSSMPAIRLMGNAGLSFLSKLSTGYWDLFDPTNGYTALHSSVAAHLPYDKISKRYFFESDLLFRLNTLRAVVIDIPMTAHYADETSHLRISKVMGSFFFGHVRNFCKRIFYNYFLRDLSPGSLQLVLGVAMLVAGSVFGVYSWANPSLSGAATAGTVMLAALPIILGIQLLLSFLMLDMQGVPRNPIHPRLAKPRSSGIEARNK